MRILKKNTENTETDLANIFNLKIENEKLKIEKETLEFKLIAKQERESVLRGQINDLKSYEIDDLKSKNEKLEKQIFDIKFKMENDTSNIELATENKKLKAKNEIQESEIKYLKELLATYREMPDVKNMIDSLSSLSVPGIEELKKFAQILSETKISQMADDVKSNNSIIKEMKLDIEDLKKYKTSRYY